MKCPQELSECLLLLSLFNKQDNVPQVAHLISGRALINLRALTSSSQKWRQKLGYIVGLPCVLRLSIGVGRLGEPGQMNQLEPREWAFFLINLCYVKCHTKI